MCFHTSQTKKVTQLEKRFKAEITKKVDSKPFDAPRYHINGFSHPKMLLIPQEGPTVLAPGYWGIAPENKKPEELPEYYKEALHFGGGLNAQSERLFDHFIYKKAALTRRCLVPVTGFFEPHQFKGKKYPFHIKQKDNDVLSLAGLYTIVGNQVTFTILTKKASPLFAKIHNKKNRQPIILQQEHEQAWLTNDLNKSDVEELIHTQYPEDNLSAYTISRELFSPKINSDEPYILEKVKYEGVEV